MKKILAVLVALITVFGATAAFAADITVKVNDEVVTFDRQPYMEGGNVMIPYRFVAEKLGATVAWDGDTKTVFTALGDIVTTLQIGNASVFTADGVINAQVAPVLVIDRTFVTGDVIAKAFGVEVNYDEATSTVTVK